MKALLIRSAIAICVVLSTLRGVAQQASAVKALEDRFKVLDKNGDGKITTDELPQSPFFEQRDKNRDGAITLAEAMAVMEEGANSNTPTSSKEAPTTNPTPRATTAQPTRQRVRPLKGGDYGVGRMVEEQ